MSIIRHGESGEWENIDTLYVYPTIIGGEQYLYGLGEARIRQRDYVETTMRILEQSSTEFTNGELEVIHGALRSRLFIDYVSDTDE